MEEKTKNNKMLGLLLMLGAGFLAWRAWKEESELKAASALGYYSMPLALPSEDGLGEVERKIFVRPLPPVGYVGPVDRKIVAIAQG